MKENKIKNAIEVFEKPSKHIKCVHKCENGMEFLTYSQYLVSAFETAIEGLKELEQYRAIGTVEKCREAREKQKAKKPICNDKLALWDYTCAVCGEPLIQQGYTYNYCDMCGNRIAWVEDGH